MSGQLQLRRGTTAENDAFTGAVGELTVDTTLDQLRLHDGVTAGGAVTIGAGGGDALTTDPLSQFAATTSLQLKNVISDETGSGALVFATSPTLVTPILGTPTSGTLTNCSGLPAAGVTGTALVSAAIGTTVQAYDADLAAIAGLTSAADKGIQFTGAGTAGTFDLTAAAKTVLDDATTDAMINTLGGASASGTGGIVRRASPTLTTPDIGTPSAGTLTNCTGLPAAGVTGTALVTAAIGTTVQAYDADLAAIAALTSAADQGIQFTGAGTAATYDLTTAGKALLDDATAADQRTTLGFGTHILRDNQSWIASAGAGVTLSNVTAAAQFLGGSNRNVQQIDLTHFTHVRLTVRVTTAATAGTKLTASYHTAFSTTLTDFVDIGTSAVETAIDATGITTSTWIALAAGAKADVFTTIKQSGGDGATDPVLASLTLQFKRE